MGVGGADEFAALSRRLRALADGRTQERLRSRLRTAGRPVEREIRSRARSLRVTGSRGGQGRPRRATNLRARTAAAVSTSVTQRGIRFVVDGGKVDPQYGAALVRYLDADLPGYRRWRHPVFGSGAWTQQTSSGGFFFATVRARRPAFEKAVTSVVDDIADDLTR